MNIIDTIRILKQDKGDFLSTTLKYIHFETGNIIIDVARIHLYSAEQAFISATTSNNSESECRVGIGHLRDSFNAYQIHLERGDKWFWGLFYTKLIPEELTDVQLKLASIAMVIALIYKRLNDHTNHISWKNTGVTFAKQYIDNRESAISSWKYAEKSDRNQGGQGAQPTYSIDYEKRQAYKDELVFIELFAETIQEV